MFYFINRPQKPFFLVLLKKKHTELNLKLKILRFYKTSYFLKFYMRGLGTLASKNPSITQFPFSLYLATVYA